MDDHDLGVPDLLEAGRHQVAAARAAGNAADRGEAEIARQRADGAVAGLRAHHDDGLHATHGRDALENVGDEGASSGLSPDLVGPRPLAAARRRDDDRDAQRVPARVGRGTVRSRPSAGCRASAAVVAKIIRPAAVWSTEVTVTCTWRSR